jgi:hypothetical protein
MYCFVPTFYLIHNFADMDHMEDMGDINKKVPDTAFGFESVVLGVREYLSVGAERHLSKEWIIKEYSFIMFGDVCYTRLVVGCEELTMELFISPETEEVIINLADGQQHLYVGDCSQTGLMKWEIHVTCQTDERFLLVIYIRS